MKDDEIVFTTGSGSIITLFGLTSTAVNNTSILKDINFYSASEVAKSYSELSFLNGSTSGISNIINANTKSMDVYTISGVKIRSSKSSVGLLKGLPKGIYVIGGRKVAVR
jgi:hypothetical protein